ncbi:MAG: hypothetical protein CMC24_01430 [Flavobacteriaceae bacterium]|nr:hypothetical protein [Flavobacteriaceae bacterium]|tara:strand:- start:1777 stop:2289 length:513 start_codon:yes stop_codon:yes gene_type:complete
MKIIIIIFTLILAAACSPNPTPSVTVGEWYMGNLKSKSFKLGSQENIELVKKVAAAYNAMDAEKLITYFSEDAKIYAYSGEELQVSLELYQSYFASVDSLLWKPHGMSTQTLEDDSIAVVSIPSSDTRYFKEQEIQSSFLFERFWIVEGKITTIVQYKRELAKNYDEIEL